MNTPKPINPLDVFNDTETACIQQGPHSTLQGPVIRRFPDGRVEIECNGKPHTGIDVRSMKGGQS